MRETDPSKKMQEELRSMGTEYAKKIAFIARVDYDTLAQFVDTGHISDDTLEKLASLSRPLTTPDI